MYHITVDPIDQPVIALPNSMTMRQAHDTVVAVDSGLDLVLHSELLELVAGPRNGADESLKSLLVVVVVEISI